MLIRSIALLGLLACGMSAQRIDAPIFKLYTVATLPAATAIPNVSLWVGDSLNGSCTTGGGSILIMCRSISSAWVAQGSSTASTGSVQYVLNASGFAAYGPTGPVNCTGTTTSCMQEAINAAAAGMFPFTAYCVGPGMGVVSLTSTLAFPTGRFNTYNAYGCTLSYTGMASNDAISIDSSDGVEINFNHADQFIYQGTGAMVHFNPQNNNGESFAGFTSGSYEFPAIAIVTSGFVPDPTRGVGIRISAPFLTLGLTSGNGIFTNNSIYFGEVNGGLTGIQVDVPGSPVNGNFVSSPSLHTQGTASVTIGGNLSVSACTAANPSVCTSTGHGQQIGSTLQIGMSGATGNWTPINGTQTATIIDANTFSITVNATAFGSLTGTVLFSPMLIYGNQWQLSLNPSGTGSTALSTWAGIDHQNDQMTGDFYRLGLLNGTNGIVAGQGSRANVFELSGIPFGAGTAVALNSPPNGPSGNRVIASLVTRATQTVGSSPYLFRNATGRPMTVILSGGSVSSVQVSIDDSTFDTVASATGASVLLQPDQWIKITYGSAPAMVEYY